MWYWIRKIEGAIMLLAFIPYYRLRGRAFYMKCRQCGAFIFDQMYAPNGLCEHCDREMALNNAQALYDQTYEEMPLDAQRGNHYRRVAGEVGKGRVLDSGCGQGAIMRLLRSDERELWGVDISRAALVVAATAVPGVRLFAVNAACLPFQAGTFDSIVCSEVLEHVPTNDVIKECFRVLRPNGTAVFTVPNGEGPIGRYYSCHIRFFSFKSIERFLEETGFEVTSSQRFGLYVPFVSRLFNFFSRLLGRDLPFSPLLNVQVPEFLASNFLIVCRKPSS